MEVRAGADMKVNFWFVYFFHNNIFTKAAIIFIPGLIFSYGVVECSLFSILMVHLSEMWKDYTLPKSAQIVNLHEGTYQVLQIIFAYIADAYWGRFPMVLCSTPIYIIGLFLCYITSRGGVLYIALVLVTLSQAAEKVTLEDFLFDQFSAIEMVRPTTEKKEKISDLLCFQFTLFVSFVALLLSGLRFQQLSLVSAIVMGVGFLWFLLGTIFYTRNKPTGSPLTPVVFVIYAAITNRNVVEYPEEIILPHVPWLRWLDKAAGGVQDEENQGRIFCSVEEVKEVKSLLKMLPLWTTFLTFSLIQATGSTFFLDEAANINKDFPATSFIVLQRLTQFTIAKLCDYATKKLDETNDNIGQRLMLFRIGIGMICSMLCCILAWINAFRWLRLLKKYSNPEKHTNVFWLFPQYLLLGIMGGLSEDGLQNFFDSQVSKSMSRYGPPFGECVTGFGKFLSAICTLFFSTRIPWIKNDINSSRLDKYYALLTVFSLLNMIIFWMVAYWYGDDRFFSEDQSDLEDGVEAVEGSSFGYNVTENTSSEQSQPQEDSMPLLNLGTRQETNVSSSGMLPKDEAERANPDAQKLNERRSFPRPSSKGILKRFRSMNY